MSEKVKFFILVALLIASVALVIVLNSSENRVLIR
jgi:hypothetical protein